jgi:cytochrome c553
MICVQILTHLFVFFAFARQTNAVNLRQTFQYFLLNTLVNNMKKISIILSLSAMCVSVAASAQAPAATKGDANAGKAKATAICSGCHGMPGTKSAYPEVYLVPKIGGQSEAYLVAALKAYREGNRYNQTMVGLASALSEKEIQDIAAYYADPAFGKAK